MNHDIVYRDDMEPGKVGFWKSAHDQHYPNPQPSTLKSEIDAKYFVECLRSIEADLASSAAYRGWSTCRICGLRNGNHEYSLNGWTWPEGYAHYVAQHLVKPPDSFFKFVVDTAPSEEDED